MHLHLHTSRRQIAGSSLVNRAPVRAAIALLASVLLASANIVQAEPKMTGGPYAITSDVAIAGSGPMTGGAYRVVVTVGEAATGGAPAGGSFRVVAGFWQGERLVATCTLDIDGNGVLESNFDGVLIARALAGIRGPTLVSGALGTGAQFTDPGQIVARINVDALDVDGDQKSLSSTDALIILRAMSGVRSDAIVTGATAPGANRTTWEQIRNQLNTVCGASFAP